MILQQLTLRDFCLFRGEQTFDLAPATVQGRHRPIVLFGGINGGGKTTLLDAIQLALYGQRARCSKRTNLSYEDFLRESIHHGIEAGNRAGVTLSFRYAAEGTEHLYELRRKWSVQDGKVRELLTVYPDDLYDGWLSENWPHLVEELLPLDISQLFFFDAEKIRTLAEDESSSKALEAAIKSLLGLDVVERLIADSTVLENRLARKAAHGQDEAEAAALEQELAQCQDRFKEINSQRSSLENFIQRATLDLRKAEERFASAGGGLWKEREQRKLQMDELVRQIKECQEELVALASGELPLKMVQDLLGHVQEQDRLEQQAGEAVIICRLLAERDERLMEVMQQARTSQKVLDRVANHLAADRQARAPADTVVRRHDLSEGGRMLLRSLCERHLPALAELAQQGLDRFARLQSQREELERADAATPPEAHIGGMLEEVKKTTGALAVLEEQARRLDVEMEPAKTAMDESEKRLRKFLESQLRSASASEDARRMIELTVKTRDTMQTFLEQVTARKIDRLSSLITESFRFLLRKGTLGQRIAIDPATFAIAIHDDADRSIPKQRLSEGEKQIFAVAVLWGLARAAGRPLPSVIDTPMARLDATHRRHLVERYFPNASHQVVIFSTDTEVDREYYRLLQPAIARAYHLNYDERARVTRGELGYFWKEKPAGSKEA
jgi:DNA sulfur modification protein DndD